MMEPYPSKSSVSRLFITGHQLLSKNASTTRSSAPDDWRCLTVHGILLSSVQCCWSFKALYVPTHVAPRLASDNISSFPSYLLRDSSCHCCRKSGDILPQPTSASAKSLVSLLHQ